MVKNQKQIIIESAIDVAGKTGSDRIFLFLSSEKEFRWFLKTKYASMPEFAVVIPQSAGIKKPALKKLGIKGIIGWAGNQSRFSRIKYAFLNAVLNGLIETDSQVVCVLGPWGTGHLDTVTVHDLSHSWSRDFPFDPRSMAGKSFFNTIMAVVDVALDIGATGREGKPIGTTFVIGQSKQTLKSSHQAVFNPFKGYPKNEKSITRPEVVESIKELAQLDGAFIISSKGIVEAAGRHLDTIGAMTKELRGLGSRHRAAAGITRKSGAVSVVVSESTGRITIFDEGKIVTTLEPVISTRLV